MLFNSYAFIFGFLPVTLLGFFWLARATRQGIALGWLVLASLFFYGWWNPVYVALIVASIVFNYAVGAMLARDQPPARIGRKALLAVGVGGDLAVLGYFKYANFFVENANLLAGADWHIGQIVLPLGISFFTFTQIAYLVDAYRREVREYDFTRYALFVTYYPHLIAGPVLHHKEMMPQFAKPSIYRYDPEHFAAGVTYFLIGLFKKVVIADGIAVYSSPVFAAAEQGAALSAADAWGGALAYTFQLYFDFSGYSDMAIGLAVMIGVRLPLNFDSPYKAVNIVDFWRRWHMTLSRFLRDYLYVPLGGNRKGPTRRYVNLLVTMLLGGLWHGAGWTFLIWGGLHGAYLVINHGWQALRARLGHDLSRSTWWGRGLGCAVTFLAVVVGWVIFRSKDLSSAGLMLDAMFGFSAGGLSPFYAEVVAASAPYKALALAGVQPAAELVLAASLLTLLVVVVAAPNSQQIMARHYWPLDPGQGKVAESPRFAWWPSRGFAVVAGLGGLWALLGLTSVSEFLYFQF
jgi:D-alanyl-lipoteichoic acid acyltransferase DltB (MBOAT superfamily)